MKNATKGRRRDRRTGQSPYQRHAKREYLYSAAYREWKARFVKRKGEGVAA